MTKLSATQEKILAKAKADIDKARNMDFYDWFRSNSSYYSNSTNEKIEAEVERLDWWKNYYNDNKSGIAHTHCNGKTIAKLQSLGLIEILYDSTNKAYNYDLIKVLNY